MGNGSSIPNNINKQTQLIQEIHAVANELSNEYTNKYLNPKFCTTVALVYNDKLMNFRHNQLDGIASTLGLVVDNPRHKQHLCSSIVKHYTDRLNLLAVIQQSLNFCSNRIFALTTGPRCDGNPEIFDQAECTKSGGNWINTVVPPNHEIPENKEWFNYLQHMQETYLKSLARLLDITKQLKEFDEDINDERLRGLGEEVEGLMDNMNSTCHQLYKLMLMKPTFTAEELRLQDESTNMNQQEAAARHAALRATKGLAPIAQK